MADGFKKLSPSWREATTAHGFGVHCVHLLEGERFSFMLTDTTKIREQGFRAVGKMLSEDELRGHLALIGFSAAVIESGIQVGRMWATTVIHKAGPG
jgi:hypothetical protein